MKWLSGIPLRAKLVALCSALVLALAAALFFELPRALDAQSRSWVQSRSLAFASFLAHGVEAAVDFDDADAAQQVVRALATTRGAQYGVVRRGDGSTLAAWIRPGASPVAPPGTGDAAVVDGDLVRVRAGVWTRAGRSGDVLLGFDTGELAERRREVRRMVLVLCGVFLLFGLAAAFAIGTVLTRPILRITALAGRVAAGEEADVATLPVERSDELGRLARVFAEMLARLYAQREQIRVINADLAVRVRERTQELARTAAALAELERTQEQLVLADRRVSVGRLAAGVAHEINNPLAFISGNLDFLEAEVQLLRKRAGAHPPPSARELQEILSELAAAVADSRHGARRVVQIVRGLKTFARDDVDERAPLALEGPIEAAISMSFHELKHRARLLRDLAPTPLVLANEVRLCQVFLNLLINAGQAIPEGATDANEIRVTARTDPAGWAVVEVRDTGAGIPSEIQGHVFDAFFTTKPVGEGSGLGLSITRNLVESFGGAIELESRVGRGSTFRVRLPPAPATGALAQRPAPASAPARRDAAEPRRRVLVIDDEPLVGQTVARLLVREAEVVTATSAAEALGMIDRDGRFDRILCDLMMPDLSGPELVAELARRDPALAGAVVLMSGGAFTESTRAFIERWDGPFLHKPFDAAALARAVHGAPPPAGGARA